MWIMSINKSIYVKWWSEYKNLLFVCYMRNPYIARMYKKYKYSVK